MKRTEAWKQYWEQRKIDWNSSYLQTWNHPHRNLISKTLENFRWKSLFEIGCGAGANLVNIIKHFPGKQLGGVDINKDAIKVASESLQGAILRIGSAEDILMSDDSTDITLSDMCLMYVGPLKIRAYLQEIKRITRDYAVFCEFHSASFLQRLKLRLTSGYNAYDYRKLLEQCGFYDIVMLKLSEADWPGGQPQKDFAWIITAKVPQRK